MHVCANLMATGGTSKIAMEFRPNLEFDIPLMGTACHNSQKLFSFTHAASENDLGVLPDAEELLMLFREEHRNNEHLAVEY